MGPIHRRDKESQKIRGFPPIHRDDQADGRFPAASSRIASPPGLFSRPMPSNIVFSEKTMFEAFKLCFLQLKQCYRGLGVV
jgi:hypothetical protein